MATYKGHSQEVCGLKWSGSGQRLASGGNDSLVHIWDHSSSTQGHTSAAKALAWCPFQSNLLASSGGEEDRKIKFWNTQTGACLNSVDTVSAAGDETLRFWNVFGVPETVRKPVTKPAREPFSRVARIR
ncbi:unnamed protein product [Brassica oleracea var. botrytis]|uniref:Uncharacterized protein n=1 Tax=Brassica oleracea TaxID=3712 RepID=A0A3P6DYB0_BRAOL|nr:unnamed protein product [Brassica oleracea]